MAKNNQENGGANAGEPEFNLLNRHEAIKMQDEAIRMTKEIGFPISDGERTEFGNKLGVLEIEEQNLKRQKKDMQDSYRGQINERRKEIDRIAKVMDSGLEVREGEVLVDFDYKVNEVRTYDPETGECLERRTMTKDEAQNPGMV